MAQTKIIRQLRELVDDKTIIEDEEYRKQNEKVDKCYEQLREYIKKDKKLKDIFHNYDIEEVLSESIAEDIFFREGFLCGARLVLEICGFSREEK